jgi:Flp pilus assembly protein TadG
VRGREKGLAVGWWQAKILWDAANSDERGSQIVEFAVSLPLVAVFLIGIFDFSQAYGLKQKLGNAAREGARIGSNQPTADLSQSAPPTVQAIGQEVGQYLKTVGLNDCNLAGGALLPASAGTLTWTVTGTGCSGGNPVVTIDRGFITTVGTMATPYSGTMTIENTQVNVQYPYQWTFGRVITLLIPGTSYAATTTIQETATMQNLN